MPQARRTRPPARAASPRPVALVTGLSRRVGRAIALELADAGCDLVGTYLSSRAAAHSLTFELAARGASLRLEKLDLSDIAAVAKLGAQLARELPRLDILVHNASEYVVSPLEEYSTPARARRAAALASRLYAVNALSPLVLTATLAELLKRGRADASRVAGIEAAEPTSMARCTGAVVALADMHALGRPRKDLAAYSMSKAAIIEMVRSLSRDLAPFVRVNAVAPGVIAWPEHGPDSDTAMQEAYLKRVPLGRAGTPEECAKVVRWLAMDAAYITGEVVRLDGGRWLA
jgi:pteridine reductase